MNSEERLKKNLEDLLASKGFPFDRENWEKAQILMASEEAFKIVLEDSLSSKEFAFDEKNWEKAQALMLDEEVFKTNLTDSLNSKEFAFDEKNWEKAAGMIYASDRSRRVALYLVSGILFLGTLLTGVYLYKSFSTPAATPISVQANPVLPETKVAESPKTKLQSSKEKSSTKPHQPKVLSIKTDLPSNSKITEKPTPVKPSFQNKVLSTVTNSKTKTVNIQTLSATSLPISVSIKPIEEKTKGDGSINQNGAPANSDLAYTSTAASSQSSEGTPSESDNKDIVPQNHETPDTLLVKNAILNTSPENEEVKDLINGISVPTNQSESMQEESVAPNDSLKTAQKETQVEKAKPADATSDSSQIVEFIEELPPDVNQGEIGRPKEYPVLFSAEAGADYLYGWKTPTSRDANSFNFVFGINYFTNIKPKMDLSIGIHYASVSNLYYSNYTSKVTRFGFGEESTVTVFTPIKLHYLFMPMRFNYNLTPLNTIGIGYNIGYLLTVDCEIETYTEKFNTKSNQELSMGRGYTEGFKVYDSQVSVFYRRRLYPNLAMNMEVFFGLTDIKDDKFFNSNVFERNSGLKLTLVYNFLRN